MTKLTEHFTLEELTHTEVRQHSNLCPANLLPDLLGTAAMLERIRQSLSAEAERGIPLRISSGYRSQAVNAAVGGSPHSDHLRGTAADFTAPGFGTPFEVAKHLAARVDELGIGQVILEFARWVHVSTRTPALAVNRIITYTVAGAPPSVGVVEVA